MIDPLAVRTLPDQSKVLFPSEDFDVLRAIIERNYPDSIVLHHGHRTSHAALVFHGLGQTPEEARVLATKLYELGMNVLCLKAKNGFGRGTKREEDITSNTLMKFCDDATSYAAQFGDRIVTYGFSKGAIHALRTTTESPIVTHCIIVSPAYTFTRHDSPQASVLTIRNHNEKKIAVDEVPGSPDGVIQFPTDLLEALFCYSIETFERLQALDRDVQIVTIGSIYDPIVNYEQFIKDASNLKVPIEHLPIDRHIDPRTGEPQVLRHGHLCFSGEHGPDVMTLCLGYSPNVLTGINDSL